MEYNEAMFLSLSFTPFPPSPPTYFVNDTISLNFEQFLKLILLSQFMNLSSHSLIASVVCV